MRSKECPKCGEDISDTYQGDDPDCGIYAGWYCEKCDEGFPDEYDQEPLEDDVGIHIDYSDIKAPQVDRCPKHPEAILEMGYGLAGGGIGVYSYCPVCCAVLSKSQDHS